MALARTFAASLLIFSFLLLHLAEAQQKPGFAAAPVSRPQTIDCGAACAGRCKLSKRPNLCKRACGSCCAKCLCVPPGTYGNLDACPCYASLLTRNQIRKCP